MAHRRSKGSLAEFARLVEQLPTGSGPATTARREAMRAQASAGKIRRGQAPLDAMDQGLRFVQELEQGLPAGSKPLVMHAFQAASDIAAEFTHFATTERVENGEMFRLTLIAMRQYLELYAVVCGDGGARRARPVAVTIAEFEQAVPLLRQWGIRIADPRLTFQRIDKLGGGVIRFDELARWVMRTQMEALSNAVLFQSSPAKGGVGGGPSPRAPPQRPSSAVALTRPPGAPTHRAPSPTSGGALLTTHALTLGRTDRKAVRLAVYRHGGARRSQLGSGAGGANTARTHPGTTIPTIPKARRWDLAERLSEVGLTQYARPLRQMGFDDVNQLLALQHACDDRDSKRLDVHNASFASLLDSLRLAPGHRVRLVQFFQNEARNAARAAHEKLLELANALPDEEDEPLEPLEQALDVDALEQAAYEMQLLRERVAELEARERQHGRVSTEAADQAAADKEAADRAAAERAAAEQTAAERAAAEQTAAERAAAGEEAVRKQKLFLRRLIRRDLARAFTTWSSVWEGVARMLRAVRRWANRPLARAFNRWETRATSLNASSETLAAARRFVRSLLSRRLKLGFETWTQLATALKASLARVRRATIRMIHTAVAYAFDLWRATADSYRQKRAVMSKVLRRVVHPGVGKAWGTWVELLAVFCKLRGAARSIMHRHVRQAWNEWVEAAKGSAGEQGYMLVARQFVRRLRQQGLARCWQTWVALVDDRGRQLATMRAVYARFLMQGAMRSLHLWREIVDRHFEIVELMRMTSVRMLTRGVARAWVSWRERMEERRQSFRVFARYNNRLLVKVWLGWYRYHRLKKAGFASRIGFALWGAEDRAAKELWGIERRVASRLFSGRGKSRERERDDAEEEDFVVEEEEGRPVVDPTQPLLPAMDGPFASGLRR